MKISRITPALTLVALTAGFALAAPTKTPTPTPTKTPVPVRSGLDTAAIDAAIGTAGEMKDDVYKVKKPRSDLDVRLQGMQLAPEMGLTAWFAFSAHGEHTMVMGDIPVTSDDLPRVLAAANDHKLEITAIKNHFAGSEPQILFVHVTGMGNTSELATAARAVFDSIGGGDRQNVGGKDGAAAPVPATKAAGPDLKKLDKALGGKGKLENGVYKLIVPRTMSATDKGMPVPKALIHHMAMFQGSPANTLVLGELLLRPDEVKAAMTRLIQAKLTPSALHTHHTHDEPRLMYIHFSGTGKADDLAKALKTIFASAK